MKKIYQKLLNLIIAISIVFSFTGVVSAKRKGKNREEVSVVLNEVLLSLDETAKKWMMEQLAPIDPKLEGVVLDSLKKEIGEDRIITDDSPLYKRAKKITEPLCLLFNRVGGLCRPVVIKSEKPYAALYKMSVVVVSDETLDVLDDFELVSVIAHELAHTVFFKETRNAVLENNRKALNIIELKCDLLAYWALEKLHIKSMTLIKALKKIVQKRINMGEMDYFCDGCLSVEDREEFLIAINGKLAKD